MADYETIAKIKDILQNILDLMGVKARVEYEDSLAGGLMFNIYSRDARILIGKQGATLHALEHILHSVVARSQDSQDADGQRIMFSIDIDNYKRNRQYNLKQVLKAAISEMKKSGQPHSLEPMPKYEPNRYIKLSI